MTELSEDEIDTILESESDGVLALADSDEPYAIPVSFGYDGIWFVFQFSQVESGRKMAFIEANPTVQFVVYRTNPNKSVESVIVTGQLREVPDDRQREAFGTLQTNASFPLDGSIWGHPPDQTASELYLLEPTEITGRAYGVGDI